MVYCSLYRMIVYILFYQDPVTREDNWFYPFKRQLIKFFLSASALIFMVRIFVICLSVILVNGHLLRGSNTAVYYTLAQQSCGGLSPRTTKLWRGYRVCPVRMYVSTYIRTFVRSYVNPL